MAEAAGGLLYDVGIGLGLAGGASIPGVEIGTGTGAGAASIPAVPIVPGESTGAVLSGSVLIPGESSGSVLSGSTLIPGEGASSGEFFILDIGPGASVGPVFGHLVGSTPTQSVGPVFGHLVESSPTQSLGPAYDHAATLLVIASIGPTYDHVAIYIVNKGGPAMDRAVGVGPGGYQINDPTIVAPLPPTNRLQPRPQSFLSPYVYRLEADPNQ
jgi:hypothetical protein